MSWKGHNATSEMLHVLCMHNNQIPNMQASLQLQGKSGLSTLQQWQEYFKARTASEGNVY